MRIGAAAAPRWWGIEPAGLPAYLVHLVATGATSVELIVHHGSATRDPSSVHLDRRDWGPALDEAERVGLHVDVHNSLDPRFRLARWSSDRVGLQGDLVPIVDLLAEVGRRQTHPPAFVVHAADGCRDARSVTGDVLTWIAAELEARRSTAHLCVELRAADGSNDQRFDRDRDRLIGFVDGLDSPRIGMCWDIANDWLTARRTCRPLELPTLMPSCVRHGHLHDAAVGGLLHAPLGEGSVPWVEAMTLFAGAHGDMSVTLEIRYRLAHEVGDPWTVLGDSVRRALSVRN